MNAPVRASEVACVKFFAAAQFIQCYDVLLLLLSYMIVDAMEAIREAIMGYF